MGALENNLNILKGLNVDDVHINQFENYFKQVEKGYQNFIEEKDVEPLRCITKFEDLPKVTKGTGLTKEIAVLKLNGGLGTTMGLEKAKSLLEINDGQTILDKILLANKNYKIIFMNSIRTHNDTSNFISSNAVYKNMNIDQFVQSVEPKIRVDDLEPVKYPKDTSLELCPNGHGDIFTSLFTSGLLDKLINVDKIKYLFISNSDNLEATVSFEILKWFKDKNLDFAIELCEKTKNDIKGGHIVKNGSKYILREVSQIVETEKDIALNPNIHPFFNTNNIWVNLNSLKRKLDKTNGDLKLPLILNRKNVNPGDKTSQEVYQLETAMGSAVQVFKNVQFIQIPRSRFQPIKTNEDLERIRSEFMST